MIIGGSKELNKVTVDFSDIDLEKLQSHEIFGLYLIGEISFTVLQDLLVIDEDDCKQLVRRIYDAIYDVSQKDDSNVAIDL